MGSIYTADLISSTHVRVSDMGAGSVVLIHRHDLLSSTHVRVSDMGAGARQND